MFTITCHTNDIMKFLRQWLYGGHPIKFTTYKRAPFFTLLSTF